MDGQQLINLMAECYIENTIKVKAHQRPTATGKLVTVKGYQKGGQAAQGKAKADRQKKKTPTGGGGAGGQPGEKDAKPSVPSVKEIFKEFKGKANVPKVVPMSAQSIYRDYVSNLMIIKELVKETRNIDAARRDSRYKDIVQEQASLLLDFFREIEKAQKEGEKTGTTKVK